MSSKKFKEKNEACERQIGSVCDKVYGFWFQSPGENPSTRDSLTMKSRSKRVKI